MVQLTTPASILKTQIDTLLGQLPCVLDGDADGVHDARVATRRIREALPLTHEWHRRNVDELASRFRRIGRALGDVRDADVRIALLSYLEAHVPTAAPSLIVIRQERERQRLRAMRKLIKRFERLEVERMLRDLGRGRRAFHAWTSILGTWRQQLGRTLVHRAQTARDSIEHTTGVYFPNRAHTTRIALKKFRYAAEIAELTGVGAGDGSIRDLKKGQDLLGDLHDRQALIDHLPAMVTTEHPDISADHVRMVVQALEADCRELHRQYVGRRSRLMEICDRTEQTFGGGRRLAAAATVTAGVVALSSAAFAWRRFAPATRQGSPEVAIRIPIGHTTKAAS
jgi:CHAD domain-containing protein